MLVLLMWRFFPQSMKTHFICDSNFAFVSPLSLPLFPVFFFNPLFLHPGPGALQGRGTGLRAGMSVSVCVWLSLFAVLLQV